MSIVVSMMMPSSTRAAAADSEDAPARFVPVDACRLLDTRTDEGGALPAGRAAALQVAERCGVPVTATAAALTVTVVQPEASGFVSVRPASGPDHWPDRAWWPVPVTSLPVTSNVNHAAHEVRANSAVVRLGATGAVEVYARSRSHMVVDVAGYFEPVDASSSGRFVAMPSFRSYDSRVADRPAPGAVTTVELEGVPADAVAVALNVTMSGSEGPDFVTVFGAGGAVPDTSTVNADRAGQTRSAGAIVGLGERGLAFVSHGGSHVMIDVLGYFTGPSAAIDDAGLFVAHAPARVHDSRTDGSVIHMHGTIRLPDATPGAGGVFNLAAVAPSTAGFLAAFPAGTARPATSTVGMDGTAAAVANFMVTGVSTDGLDVYALTTTHVAVDRFGYFVGEPGQSAGIAAVNDAPAPRRVYVVTDSALAGIRWYGQLDRFTGFEAHSYMESCRRLVYYSCRGREGYAPRTALAEIEAFAGIGPDDLLVIGVGYNDWETRFAGDFATVTAAAYRAGFHHIAWLTLRENGSYLLPGSSLQRSANYAAMNTVMRAEVMSGRWPGVEIWDYATATANAHDWFYSDGVHTTPYGAGEAARWISEQVALFDVRTDA